MMRSWVHFTRGRFVRQARVGLGDLREEHLSRQGFQGPVAMIYRTEGPNEVVRVEGDYRARNIDSADVVSGDADDPRGDWQVLLSNDDVAVGISRRRQAMPFCYRDVAGDLLYFVHRGSGTMATEFGPIAYEPGDYILLPKGTTFQHLPDDRDHIMLVVEAPAPIRMSEHENVGRHTPLDPTMLDVPDIVDYGRDYGRPRQAEYEVRLRHGFYPSGGHSSIFYKNDPLQAVGWKGDLFPFKLNIRHILPIMSDRIHLAPSSWATFEAAGVAVLSFVPQIAVANLEAEELPSYHRNIDMDEVMLTHDDGNPSGRRPGGFRHTPQGILHGAPEAYRAEFEAKRQPGDRRRGTSVGVDTYRPLIPTAEFTRMAG
jgi:homogentisate 1,2-dioxygenase